VLVLRADDHPGARDVEHGGRGVPAVPPGLRGAEGAGGAGEGAASGMEVFHKETDKKGKKA